MSIEFGGVFVQNDLIFFLGEQILDFQAELFELVTTLLLAVHQLDDRLHFLLVEKYVEIFGREQLADQHHFVQLLTPEAAAKVYLAEVVWNDGVEPNSLKNARLLFNNFRHGQGLTGHRCDFFPREGFVVREFDRHEQAGED